MGEKVDVTPLKLEWVGNAALGLVSFFKHKIALLPESLTPLRLRDVKEPGEKPPFDPEPIYRTILKIIVWMVYHPKVVGMEHVPKTGPAVLIANHVSYLDGPIISAICKRPIRYVIDKTIYEQPGINYFMRHNRAIPIMPKKEVVEAALEMISEGLKQGDLICIFPEGRLTYTGHLGRFKTGIESMIQRDPVPVIPIGLEGLWGSIFSRKYLRAAFRWVPRNWWSDVRVVVGYPVPPEQVKVDKLQKVVLSLLQRAREL